MNATHAQDRLSLPRPAEVDQGRGLRILTVTNMYPTPSAPMFGIFVEEQVASLRRRGLAVDVLLVNGVEEGWGAYLRGYGSIRQALRRTQYDLVHAHYVFSGDLLIGQRLLPGVRVPPVVLTQHGIETQIGWTAPLCRWTSRRVTRSIATSRRVEQALGLPDIVILPCGVDTALFQPMPAVEARAALGLPQAARLVLFAGVARRPEKRFDLIEAAVARLRETQPNIQLVVAESEPHERMPLFMNACDVLILASTAEGSPMVVKEAMACNLPIVSVPVGDVEEVIGGTAGCYLAEPNAESLARQLSLALAFDSRTNGREAVMRTLSLDAIATRLEGLYWEMLER
jgi:teichuronic acid biosynthesis glycosyltransferase TuaC